MNTAVLERPVHETSHVLIVDGDAKAAECLAMLLRLSDPDITTAWAQTGHAALTIASELRPHVAIIVVGEEANHAASVAGDVLSNCFGARPLMIALTAAPVSLGATAKPGNSATSTAAVSSDTTAAPVISGAPGLDQIFDHVLAKPFELPNLVSLVTRRRAVMQPG